MHFAQYLTNFAFLIYSGIALAALLVGFAFGYRLGKEDGLQERN